MGLGKHLQYAGSWFINAGLISKKHSGRFFSKLLSGYQRKNYGCVPITQRAIWSFLAPDGRHVTPIIVKFGKGERTEGITP